MEEQKETKTYNKILAANIQPFIIKDDIEETIKSMGYIGRVGMRSTDTEILNVMIDRADINQEC